MKSMTGYGVSRYKEEGLDLEISVKTVNGRFFEMRSHSPREYVGFEQEIKKVLTQKIRRGTVDIYIQRRKLVTSKDVTVVAKMDLASKWIKTYKGMAKDLGLENDLNMSTLVRVPEMISVEGSLKASPGEKKFLLSVLKEALDKCDRERKREGLALKADLINQLSSLLQLVKSMEKHRHEANEKLRQRYLDRLTKLGVPGEVEPQRVAQEVVIQIDKADICEEMTRLKEHIKVFKKFMTSTQVQGKKLEFYTQELLREVNTVGSKSQVSELTHLVVEAKTIVERIREQVQNVE